MVESPYSCKDQSLDQALANSIAGERSSIGDALQLSPIPTVPARRSSIEKALGAHDPRPLILLYVGHATIGDAPERLSELCLANGPVAVDALLKKTYDGIGYLFLLIDACRSANVDVSFMTVPTAVLSASPDLVETTQRGGTALGGSLVQAFACADTDGDGCIDDRELLESLLIQVGQPVLGVTPVPLLRRQARHPLPVAVARSGQACRIVPTRPAPIPPPQEVAGGTTIWHGGWVDETITTKQGHVFQRGNLKPIWCSHLSFGHFGQCFEVLPSTEAVGANHQ
jgi:hypothetical protein